MSNTIIQVENVSKEYRLGAIGGGTLRGDLQSFWAKIRGKDALVNVVTYLNEDAKAAKTQVQVGLWDAQGKLVAEADQDLIADKANDWSAAIIQIFNLSEEQ